MKSREIKEICMRCLLYNFAGKNLTILGEKTDFFVSIFQLEKSKNLKTVQIRESYQIRLEFELGKRKPRKIRNRTLIPFFDRRPKVFPWIRPRTFSLGKTRPVSPRENVFEGQGKETQLKYSEKKGKEMVRDQKRTVDGIFNRIQRFRFD